ncbi:LysR family transcriptional regulator [Pseudescherichia vulneris]|uniref:LysR family transcriptional regulator n=1 Tax=Pseudescherichia vulneris TaxID=566 RepID=UPI00227CA0B6|nr:LysR family transcriptional regulator [Pseudescherichia vulneris]WAH53495.1 LysR family transcriptional regulator [Pseudescherichia vulneris]
MDLHQLRCFIAVAEELNFGRAAVRLNMTQPPLSRQIQLLEKRLGGTLFDRNNRHVQLTHMGEHLLKESRLIVKLADRLESSVQQSASGETGTLAMGFTAVFSWSFIPQLLKELTVKLPGVDFQLFEQVSHKQISSVEDNTIDVGFVRHVPPNPRLAWLPLQGETFVAAFHCDHPLARKRKIPLSAFNNEPFFLYSPNEARQFYDRITDLFVFSNVTPDFKYQLAQTHTILGLVNAGLGCAIVPASSRTLGLPNVTFMAIEGVNIQAHNFLVYSKVNPNPVLPVFLKALSEALITL